MKDLKQKKIIELEKDTPRHTSTKQRGRRLSPKEEASAKAIETIQQNITELSPSSSPASKNISEAKLHLKEILTPFQKKLKIFNHVVQAEGDSTPEQVYNFKDDREHSRYIHEKGSPFEKIVFDLSPRRTKTATLSDRPRSARSRQTTASSRPRSATR